MTDETLTRAEVLGWAVHTLTTSIRHKAATPASLDEACAVLGRALDTTLTEHPTTCAICGSYSVKGVEVHESCLEARVGA